MKYGLPSFKFECGGVYNKLWLVILIVICTAQQVLPACSWFCLRIAGKLPEMSADFLCLRSHHKSGPWKVGSSCQWSSNRVKRKDFYPFYLRLSVCGFKLLVLQAARMHNYYYSYGLKASGRVNC